MSRPNISIFTPTYGDSKYLADAWNSIQNQVYTDWEWVVLVNNSTVTDLPIEPDPRVRLVYASGDVHGVGHAKRLAVEQCEGDILVELDHDDMLMPFALVAIAATFEGYPDSSLVYSRFTQVDADGNPDPQRFDASYGWQYDEVDGFQIPKNLVATPHNVSLIWYAPNHVRAFRRSAYDATAGYDASLKVLDDLSLMSELYRVGDFVSIDQPLYYQRIHGGNTQLDLRNNQEIQSGTWDLYERNVLDNYRAWAKRCGLKTIQGRKDLHWHEDLDPNTFGLIRYEGDDGFYIDTEMIYDAHHLLAPNGLLSIWMRESVPFNEHYFRAWCATEYAPFQESRIATWEIDGEKWIEANLIAVKRGYTREGGILYAGTAATT